MYSLWYAYFIYKNNNVKIGDIPFLRKPPADIVSGPSSTPTVPKAVQPPPSAPVRTSSTPKDIPGRNSPVKAPVPPPVKKAPPSVQPTNRFLPGHSHPISDHLNACISAVVRRNAVEQQAAIEAFVRTAGYLESERERQALEERVRADIANKDRELAAALDRCLKEAGKEAEELAVKHAREAFERVTKKFNDEMAAASAKVAADRAAAKEASVLGPRIREVTEKTAKDEFLALEECVKSAEAFLSSENQAAALEKCLQNAAARKAAADSMAMRNLLEDARKKIAAEEESARQTLLQDLLERERAEATEVEQCVKEATAKKVAEETTKVEQLYKKKAQETLALVDAEVDLCVKNVADMSSAEMRDKLETCIKQAAKKKADTDAATMEALVADAARKIEDEELVAIHICTQRAMNKLKGEDGAGPSGKPYGETRRSLESDGKDKAITPSIEYDATSGSRFSAAEDDAKNKLGLALGSAGGSSGRRSTPGEFAASSQLGSTPGTDDMCIKAESTPEDDGAKRQSESTFERYDTRSKSSNDDKDKIDFDIRKEGRYDQSFTSKKVDDDHMPRGTSRKYEECTEALTALATTRRNKERVDPQMRGTPKRVCESDQLPRTGHWKDGECFCVPEAQTLTKRDNESEVALQVRATIKEKKQSGSLVVEDAHSDTSKGRVECIKETPKQIAQKKTSRAPVTVLKDYESARATPSINSERDGQSDISKVRNGNIEVSPKQMCVQKKTSRESVAVVKDYESAKETSPIIAGRNYVNLRESSGGRSLASTTKSSKSSGGKVAIVSPTVSTEESRPGNGSVREGSKESFSSEAKMSTVSYGVQMTEEMRSEEVQTVEVRSEVNTEQVQTENEARSMEVQTTDDGRPAQGTQSVEWCIPEDANDPPQGTYAPSKNADQRSAATAKRENPCTLEPFPQIMSKEGIELTSDAYSQCLQCMAEECGNEDELPPERIAMCEAIARAVKLRELQKNSRSPSERERLEREANELETLVAELAATQATKRNPDIGILRNMDKASDLRAASRAASSQSEKCRLANEAAEIERLVAETMAICEAKVEAARLREAAMCTNNLEEKKCLERAASDRETLVKKLECCVAMRRESEARKIMTEVLALREAARVTNSNSERERFEREAAERERLIPEDTSVRRAQIEASRLREAAKWAQGPEERCCLERAAEESEAFINSICGVSGPLSKNPSSRDVTERPSSIVRQGTRRPTSRKDSHGPKRNMKASPESSYADAARKDHLPRRSDQKSFSCTYEILVGPLGSEKSARKRTTDLPVKQLSRAESSLSLVCRTVDITAFLPRKGDNPCKRSQSHPLTMKRSDSGKFLAETSRSDSLEQFSPGSRRPPSDTKKQCRVLAERMKQGCGKSGVTEYKENPKRKMSNVFKAESKSSTRPTSSSSARSAPSRMLDGKNHGPAPLPQYTYCVRAKTESVGVSTEPGSKVSSEGSNKKRALVHTLEATTSDPVIEHVMCSSVKGLNEPKSLKKFVELSPDQNELPLLKPEDEETCTPVQELIREKSLSTVLEHTQSDKYSGLFTTECMAPAPSLTVAITTPHRLSDKSIPYLQVTSEPPTQHDQKTATEIRDQKCLQVENDLNPRRSTSYNSRSEDNLLHETADIMSTCSGENSKLSYRAVLDTVEECHSKNYVECGTLCGAETMENIKSGVSRQSNNLKASEAHEPDLAANEEYNKCLPGAFETAVMPEQCEPETPTEPLEFTERRPKTTESKTIRMRTVDSTTETRSPSGHCLCFSVGSSIFGNIPTDSASSRETSVRKHERQKKQKSRSGSPLSDTSKSTFVPSSSTEKKSVSSHVKGKSTGKRTMIVRQSTSAMSLSVEECLPNAGQSSKSEHDLIVEDVILAVEATARYAAGAAAARDRAFEAAGVAVRAVACEDVSAARRAVCMSRVAAEAAVEQSACAARESIKAISLSATSKCNRRTSALATASALAAQQDCLAAERFFSHAADALRCLEVPDSLSSVDRLAAATFKQVITFTVNTADKAAKARGHLAEAASAAEAVECILADPSKFGVDVIQHERAAVAAAKDAADAAAQAHQEAETAARACVQVRKVASPSCQSVFVASAARHSCASADDAKIEAAAALEAASAANTYAQRARDAAAVIACSTVSETAKIAACSAALVAAAKTTAARSASECSQAKAAASEAAAQVSACMPAGSLCNSHTENTNLEAFALAKVAEADAAASIAAEKAEVAAFNALRAKSVSLSVQELTNQDEKAAIAGRYATAAAEEAIRLAGAASEDAEAANNEALLCRTAAANVCMHLPSKLSVESVVLVKNASQFSFESKRRSVTSHTSREQCVTHLPELPDT